MADCTRIGHGTLQAIMTGPRRSLTGSNVTGQNVRHHLAAFDAATGGLKSWAPAVSGPHGVWALWASGGSIVAGGDFQVVAATVAAGLARFPAA